MVSRKLLGALVATLASAGAFYYGTGLQPHWWLAWLAPIPVLLAAPSRSRRATSAIAFAALFLGGMNLWGFLRGVLGLPLGVVLAALILPGVMFVLTALLFRSFCVQGKPGYAALAAAGLWVSLEYLSSLFSPHGTFGNLAYSQMKLLSVIQVASLTGIWGISFLILLFAAAVSVLVRRIGTAEQRRRVRTSVLAVLCCVALFGWWRLRVSDAGKERVSVALVAKDISFAEYADNDAAALAIIRQYADEVRRTTRPGTDVVVLPEKIARVSESAMPEVDALLSQTASDVKATIVVGLVRKTPGPAFNESRAYSEEGKLEAVYAKHHLIPGLEPEIRGNDRVVLVRRSGKWGLTICKDMDFPKLSREYSQDGAGLMVVPAWDFQIDGWAHASVAILRGVEGGFAVARSARSGLVTLSDSRGRVLAEAASSSAPFVSVSGKMPVGAPDTPYRKLGDWLAWMSVLGATILVIRSCM